MLTGLQVVFEGPDGSGKSTALASVTARLRSLGIEPVVAYQPGSTPLADHLRKLTKNPIDIISDSSIDTFTRQLLMAAAADDCFKKIVNPALDQNKLVLLDRSSLISALVYSMIDNADLSNISNILSTLRARRIDRLYIFQCSLEERLTRSKRESSDHWDDRDIDFKRTLGEIYDNLIFDTRISVFVQEYVNLDNVMFIDGSNSIDMVTDIIVSDILERMRLYS